MTQAQDVEFIGMIQPRAQSEVHPPSGPAIDPGYLRASAQAHDEGGFGQVFVLEAGFGGNDSHLQLLN